MNFLLSILELVLKYREFLHRTFKNLSHSVKRLNDSGRLRQLNSLEKVWIEFVMMGTL